jgi:L-asparaginase/beta-aspartyl-peptidase (threonine type)
MFQFFYVLHNAVSAVSCAIPVRRTVQGLQGENKNMSNTSNTQDYAIVVHGGAESPRDHDDGCRHAARRAVEELGISADALEAAIAAVVAMEDDGRFNAGSGAVSCLDGATVEMDAAIMDTRGRLGAVACVQGVKNPVLLARTVYGWIDDGMPLAQALERGVDLFDARVPVGLIAVSRTDAHAHSNQDMPNARIVAS